MTAMPMFLWLPFIIFSAMFETPKSEPAPVRIPSHD
jgi:hypothetical protein